MAAAARAFSFARSGAARPFFVTWRARPKATAPAGTSPVMTLPAIRASPCHRKSTWGFEGTVSRGGMKLPAPETKLSVMSKQRSMGVTVPFAGLS